MDNIMAKTKEIYKSEIKEDDTSSDKIPKKKSTSFWISI